jgi:hypothetical protein
MNVFTVFVSIRPFGDYSLSSGQLQAKKPGVSGCRPAAFAACAFHLQVRGPARQDRLMVMQSRREICLWAGLLSRLPPTALLSVGRGIALRGNEKLQKNIPGGTALGFPGCPEIQQ